MTTRSVEWIDDAIVVIDQRALPRELRTLRLTSVPEVIGAIRTLAVRGAPAIGAAGALGVALAARHHHCHGGADDGYDTAVRRDAARLTAARPTAVNLRWAVERTAGRLSEGPDAVLAEALSILAEDEEINRRAATHAADLVLRLCGRRPLRLLTHCNTGRLATVGWGTALGAIRHLARNGHVLEVLVGETRPLLQGARLTTWELTEADIAYRLCVDAAGPAAIASGLVDCVLVGADTVAANGDVANKIGTYALAVAAARHGVPFLVVAPESTVATTVGTGHAIVIEERAASEVTGYAGHPVAPSGAAAYNPAFDVTPADLVTAVVTENGIRTPDTGSVCRTADAENGSCDPMALYARPDLLRQAASEIHARFSGTFDLVAGVEGRGFLLGVAVALSANRPFVPLYRYGPGLGFAETSRDAVPSGARVLIVDEVLAAGTSTAAASLLGRCGAALVGYAAAVDRSTLRSPAASHPVATYAVCRTTEPA